MLAASASEAAAFGLFGVVMVVFAVGHRPALGGSRPLGVADRIWVAAFALCALGA